MIAEWEARWPQAAAELREMLRVEAEVRPTAPGTEARVQSEVRLEAARAGVRLFRNNVGAMIDDNGRAIRYGLANDSAALNARIKSGDLIGWRPVIVTPQMIGRRIAQFVSRECKRPGWHLTPGDERGQAQARWAALVASDGGDACFANSVGTFS
jgi:hypothetical protein